MAGGCVTPNGRGVALRLTGRRLHTRGPSATSAVAHTPAVSVRSGGIEIALGMEAFGDQGKTVILRGERESEHHLNAIQKLSISNNAMLCETDRGDKLEEEIARQWQK